MIDFLRRRFRPTAKPYDIDRSPNNEIEVLRAVAILATIFGHLAFTDFGKNSLHYQAILARFGFWSGVDLFFCISGFVITRSFIQSTPLLHKGFSRPYFRASVAFWIRRFYRLTPSVVVWLGVFIAAAALFNHSGMFVSVWGNIDDALAAIFYVANFHFSRCIASPGHYSCGAAGVYWSLSLEEQFYFLFPLLLMMRRRYVSGLLAALFVAQMFVTRDIHWLYLRTDALCLGILLGFLADSAIYADMEPTCLKRFLPRWAVLGVLLVSLVGLQGGNDPITSIVAFPFTIIPVVALLLVGIASYDRGYLMQDSVLRRTLVWIGKRSFALYLIHDFCLLAMQEILFRWRAHGYLPGHKAEIALCLWAFALMAVLAHLNYVLLERPLRRRGKHIAEEYAARSVSGEETPRLTA